MQPTRSLLPSDHPVRVEMRRQARQKQSDEAASRRAAGLMAKRALLSERQCRGCGVWFCPLNQPRMLDCSRRCAARYSRRTRRAREAGATGSYTWGEFIRIAKRFDFCCAYCSVKPDELVAEHVLALSRGGSNSPTNLLPSCHLCNSDKSALSMEEWAASRAARGLPPVATTWDPADPRYRHLTSVIPADTPPPKPLSRVA